MLLKQQFHCVLLQQVSGYGKSARIRLLVYGPKLAVLKNVPVRVLKLERGKSNEFDFFGVSDYRVRVKRPVCSVSQYGLLFKTALCAGSRGVRKKWRNYRCPET
jgi:hypothetical protein